MYYWNILHWSQTREYFLFTGKYIFNEFSLLSLERRCRYKSHMVCLFVSAGSTYVGVSEGSFVHNRFNSWPVGSAISHEHSRMPFANRIDPIHIVVTHNSVLYVARPFALWIFCVCEYILGPTGLDLSLKRKFSCHKYHYGMLNSDYWKCSAEIVHVLRSLVLDAFVPSRWPPFHESSLMAYALRFVFLRKSCRFHFTTFTKYVCIVHYHNARSILWGYWRLSSTFHHDKRIFHWHWFCWWACPRVLVTSFSFHFPILRHIY